MIGTLKTMLEVFENLWWTLQIRSILGADYMSNFSPRWNQNLNKKPSRELSLFPFYVCVANFDQPRTQALSFARGLDFHMLMRWNILSDIDNKPGWNFYEDFKISAQFARLVIGKSGQWRH